MKNKQYWSAVCAMLGVALIAAAFFEKDNWTLGMLLGIYSSYWGSKLAGE